jgi:hypothetical protein
MVDLEQKSEDEALDKEAALLKKRKERVLKRFKRIQTADHKHFQYEFVLTQAKEICNYLKDMEISPLKGWHGDLKEIVTTGNFMNKYYLTYNDLDEIVPDLARIDKLILPEPLTEDEVRAGGSMDFE